MGHAALAGPMVPAQPPPAERAVAAWLEDVARDRGIPHLHDIGGDAFHLDALVRRIEALLGSTGHGCPIVVLCRRAYNGRAIGP
jgi:hypothetical protein